MKVKQVRQKATIFAAGALTALLFARSVAAHAGMFDIFSVINSTIGSQIGGTLSAMNSIASTLQKDEQTLLFPVSLINQSRSFVSTIIGSYRSWMSTVFTMQTGSAQLSQNQLLELEAMSARPAPSPTSTPRSPISTRCTTRPWACCHPPSPLRRPIAR